MMVAKEKQRAPDGKNRRREPSNEAKAILRTLRISPQNLNLVAQIRGLSAEKAVNELRFSQKRIAKDVLKCRNSAIDNAENNHGLDVMDRRLLGRSGAIQSRVRNESHRHAHDIRGAFL